MASFPAQNLTRAQKIEKYGSEKEFGEAVLNSLDNFRTFSNFRSEEWKIHENYNLLEGRFNKEDYQGNLDFFGDILKDFKMPVDLEHYDLMSPKYELLKGEEIKRPFNHKVVSTNPDVVTRLQNKKNDAIKERMNFDLQQAMAEQGLIEVPPGQEMPPPDYPEIERYFNLEYKDKIEVLAANSLEYLKSQLHLDWVFNEGWGHYLKSAREFYWVGDIEGEPIVRPIDSRFFAFELSRGLENVERSSWAIEWRYLTAADCHEEFHSSLSEEDVEKIEELKGQVGKIKGDIYLNTYYSGDEFSGEDTMFRMGNETLLKVVRCEWMALRKVGIVSYLDENNDPQETVVDEEFKKKNFPYEVLNIEWEWLDEPWEATKIGDDIFVNVRPIPDSDFSLDNLGRRKLQYVGHAGKYSIVEKMKQWNLFYDVIMMKMKQEIVTSMGNVAVFDVTQIPRSEGFDMDKWLYYLNVMKIGFVNGQEEGQRGKASGFNQWKTMNLSHAEQIQQYIGLANYVENKIASITGITPQREGQVAASETVGGVERSVQSSSYITEYMFYTHAETKRRVLERLLDRAKFSWRDGKKASYIADSTRYVLDIPPGNFAHENIGIFVDDKGHDHEAMQLLRQAALAEIQSGNGDLKNLLTVLKSDNLTKMEVTLDRVYADKAEQQQAAAQAEAQNAQAAAQAKLQADMQLEQFKEQNANQRNTEDNQTKLQVAQLQFTTKIGDANRNGVLDTIEAELEAKKLALETTRQDRELELKQRELDLEDKWKTKELSIKETQAKKSSFSKYKD
jgi:hypothetical protein